MKKPTLPPQMNDLLKEAYSDADKLNIIISNMNPIHNNRYLHWNTVQYLQPPTNLSTKEWWASIKMSRIGQLRPIQLLDIHGSEFKFCVVDPVLEYLHKIDQRAGGSIQTKESDVINQKTQEKYMIHSLIEEAITSSQLEGATSTRKVAKEMIRTEREPRDKSEKMILNNYRTMILIKRIANKKISIGTLLEIHRKLTEQTLDNEDAVGRFRKEGEDIRVYDNMIDNQILHTPPPASELYERIQKLCDFANGKTPLFYIHPVIRSIILHFWLAYDHPFVDGNGRCARALFYWSMLRHNYWLFEYLSVSQILKKAPSQYGRSFLYSETDDNDLTYFILYNLNVIIRATNSFYSYIQSRSKELKKIDLILRGTDINFNHRQIDLIRHALRHDDAMYTIKGHQKTNKIVYQTARTDLTSLERIGLLKKKLRGNEMVFYPANSIEDKLKNGLP